MKTNYLKLGAFSLMMMVGATIQAQTTNPDGVAAPKQTKTTLGSATTNTAATEDAANGTTAYEAPAAGTTVQGGSVRVIDNKGTIKYLQVQNGITQVTNTTPAGGITTTWQLGGQLANDTDIDFNGSVFSFDNVVQVDPTDTTNGVPATTFTTAKGQGNTGWSILVRDENTGAVKKLAAADLIVSGQTVFTATMGTLTFDVSTAGSANGTVAIGALAGALIPLPEYSKVWVYRNGAKLIANVDYTISGSIVTLVENTTEPFDWTLFTGDQIEIQYFK